MKDRAEAAPTSRVLLVEDSATQAEWLAGALRKASLDVTIAPDAEEAFEDLSHQAYDLVLTDWHLPGVSGLRLCRSIRASEALRGTRCIVMTADDAPEGILRALVAGAHGYYCKNRPVDELVTRVCRLLSEPDTRVRSDGERLRILVNGQAFELAPEPVLVEFLVYALEDAVDIGKRLKEGRAAIEALRSEAQARLQSVLNAIPVGVVFVDASGAPTLVNEFAEALLGEIPHLDSWIETFGIGDVRGESIRTDQLPVAQTLRGGAQPCALELSISRPGVGKFPVIMNSRAVSGDGGSVLEAVAAVTSLEEVRRAEERLFHAVSHDALTGLSNRSVLIDRVSSRLSAGSGTLTILLVGLDRFRSVAGNLGQTLGDLLLLEACWRIRDTCGSSGLVARYGDDDFAVVLDSECSGVDPICLAEELQRAFAEDFDLGPMAMKMSVSIGVARSSSDDAEELLRNAELAKLQAQERGGGRHVVFVAEMGTRSRSRFAMEADLRRALGSSEIEAFYQPIVSLRTGRLTGFEALARWRHPERGLVPPDEFIPCAESSGLVVPLDRWILERACRDVQELNQRVRKSDPLSISVNLSAKQFLTQDLVGTVERTVREVGIAPGSVKLEITESTAMQDSEDVGETVRALRRLGVSLCIDDFGTGYSSLSSLHRLPFDCLKIDRAFVARSSEGESGIEIIRTIIALARRLGMDTIAEGVETEKQLHTLRDLRCEHAQGFLLSKPLEIAGARVVAAQSRNWIG